MATAALTRLEGEAGGAPAPVVFVTGMSGAGNSTAIHALEDLGFEAIDNLPLGFIERLFPAPAASPAAPARTSRPVAIGIDARTRGFTAEACLAALADLRESQPAPPRLLFLDCADTALVDRFKTTRRRHPLAPGESVELGIARERELLWPLRERADLVIDTTDLTPHQLKARVAAIAGRRGARRLAISIQSFSCKRGAPREADAVFDCRFLSNPHWDAALRPLDGRDPGVVAHVRADPLYAPFLDQVTALTRMLLPAYGREGKAHYCIAFGCSGGRHRSVAAAEDLAARLRAAGWPVALMHREIGAAEAASTGQDEA